MNIGVNFTNLVRQLLPPHKRQPVRAGLLGAFAVPLQTVFDGFGTWRENARMLVNVNSQVKVLEGYLRKKYRQPVTIKIVTFNNGLLPVGLISEGRTMWPQFGLAGENAFRSVPLENEIRDKFDGADFLVYIPEGTDMELINAEVEKYRHVLTTYKIIQQ